MLDKDEQRDLIKKLPLFELNKKILSATSLPMG